MESGLTGQELYQVNTMYSGGNHVWFKALHPYVGCTSFSHPKAGFGRPPVRTQSVGFGQLHSLSDMITLAQVHLVLQVDSYMVSLGLKGVYWHIPVHPRFRD